MFEAGEPRLEVLVTSIDSVPQMLAELIRTQPVFEAQISGETRRLRLGIVAMAPVTAQGAVASKEPIAQLHPRIPSNSLVGTPVQGGDTAWGETLPGQGTVGWSFVLNRVVVALSNWHVFCPNGNDTPLGWNLFLNNNLEATLSAFQALSKVGNIWDYALGQYINASDALAEMRPCDDGSQEPYPMALSKGVVVGDGATYHKVGAREPICRTGTLNGVGSISVDYKSEGGVRVFDNQLIFSKMSDPGDSGSVIVRESDNTVTGLIFAGNDGETDANPIFQAGWSYMGTLRLSPNGPDLPCFAGDVVPAGQRGGQVIDRATWGTDQSLVGLMEPTQSSTSATSSFHSFSRKQASVSTERSILSSAISSIAPLRPHPLLGGLPGFGVGKSIIGLIGVGDPVPGGTTDKIPLNLNNDQNVASHILCLGDPSSHGFSIAGSSLAPSGQFIPIGSIRHYTVKSAPFTDTLYLELADRNDSSKDLFLKIATRLTIGEQDPHATDRESIFDYFWNSLWIDPPPPPRPGRTGVKQLDIFEAVSDSVAYPDSPARPMIHRQVTTTVLCFG